jgi:hypothetical protein
LFFYCSSNHRPQHKSSIKLPYGFDYFQAAAAQAASTSNAGLPFNPFLT